jgi:exodeoxyribonuclease VII large subunit
MAVKSYTVGQINGYIKNLVQSDYLLGNVSVKGEVSNCKYHSSGHIYFSLKDETGAIAAVMFRGNVNTGLNFKLENGQMVVAAGSVNVYERDGRYQLYVKNITLDGAGNLYEKYELLKQKLYEQGLFEFDIKKPIPAYPKAVGIVTSKTGAAIQDIMNIARRRNPYVQLVLYPAKVQGDGAAEDIARGIEVLDSMGLDTIIIGRGGGSIEDLWAFNEEVVAWAIYNAHTPIISGTGHEIDNTIADYAADLRAPTPSAACELAIPDVMTTVKQIITMENHMTRALNMKISGCWDKLNSYERHFKLLNPQSRLHDQQQHVDELSDRLIRAVNKKYEARLNRVMLLTERINGLSPTAKLINGFGYISCNNEPITTASAVKQGDIVNITVHDGTIETEVKGISINEQLVES